MNTKKVSNVKSGDANGPNVLHQAGKQSDKFKKVNESLGKSFLQKSIDEAESQAKQHKIAQLSNLKGKPVNIINTTSGEKGDLTAAENELSGIAVDFLKHYNAKVQVGNVSSPNLAQAKKGQATQLE